MKQRLIVYLSIFALLLSLLTGCAASNNAAADDSDKNSSASTEGNEQVTSETSNPAELDENSASSDDESDGSASVENGAKVIRVGLTGSDSDAQTLALWEMEKIVEEKSNGTIDMQIFNKSMLGDERDLIEGTSLGTVEMCVVSTGPISNFTDALMILELPYAIKNTPEGREKAYGLLDGEVGAGMLAGMEESINVKGLGFWQFSFRSLINSKREVVHPEDLDGLRIRTNENSVHIGYYGFFGATGLPMSSGEAYTALQQGVIDGMDNGISSFYDNAAHEVAGYITQTDAIYSAMICMVNRDFWDSLTEEERTIITEAEAEVRTWEREKSLERSEECSQYYKDHPELVTYTEIDYDEWQEACKPYYEEYVDQIDPALIEAFIG